ncbi:tetratricopeptide repeat protein [Alkalibacillus haloalkaliphilus]|uniref:tetratricopeptide repeat protein n=1 Tax=Alkalibacillus haloalkaliphilus TaxID=94136 RepID=UPI000314187C|nr:tetratricopeptide repeat protein [Alkalibacillus haloalkaliphilus]
MTLDKLKKELSHINEFVYFDEDDYLREKASNLSKVNELIKAAEQMLNFCKIEEDQFFIQGALGNLYRVSECPKRSIYYLEQCYEYAVHHNDLKKEIVTLIRLGEAQKYADQHERAINLFNEAIRKCKSFNETKFLDFALQHKGKCLLELKRFEEAESCLQDAYALRLRKNSDELINSTKKAIDLLKFLKQG